MDGGLGRDFEVLFAPMYLGLAPKTTADSML